MTHTTGFTSTKAQGYEADATVGRRFLLNAAFMSTPGHYVYTVVDDEAAREWLKRNPAWISMIGYHEACEALEILFGISVRMNREKTLFEPGDEALVFRLDGRVDPQRKGKLGLDYQLHNYELGILQFIDYVDSSSEKGDSEADGHAAIAEKAACR